VLNNYYFYHPKWKVLKPVFGLNLAVQKRENTTSCAGRNGGLTLVINQDFLIEY